MLRVALLIFVVIFPIWNLTSVAQMVSRGIMHIPTAVYDQNQSQTSRELVTMLAEAFPGQSFEPSPSLDNQRTTDRRH